MTTLNSTFTPPPVDRYADIHDDAAEMVITGPAIIDVYVKTIYNSPVHRVLDVKVVPFATYVTDRHNTVIDVSAVVRVEATVWNSISQTLSVVSQNLVRTKGGRYGYLEHAKQSDLHQYLAHSLNLVQSYFENVPLERKDYWDNVPKQILVVDSNEREEMRTVFINSLVARVREELQTNDPIKKGSTIKVVRGRKIPHGTTGVVFWSGVSQWGLRYGFKDSSGTVFWAAAGNVELDVQIDDATVIAEAKKRYEQDHVAKSVFGSSRA